MLIGPGCLMHLGGSSTTSYFLTLLCTPQTEIDVRVVTADVTGRKIISIGKGFEKHLTPFSDDFNIHCLYAMGHFNV